LAEIVEWLRNPEVVRYSEQRHRGHSMVTQRAYINSLADLDSYLGIWNENTLIGTLSVQMDEPNKVANVGLMIGEASKWGQGYGLEAWTAVCDRLFATGVRKVEAGCMACNLGMMGICTQYGMTEEGRQADHFNVNGSYIDLVHWGKFK
jgi:RimJ/RimL family protein N-acetyltransferase